MTTDDIKTIISQAIRWGFRRKGIKQKEGCGRKLARLTAARVLTGRDRSQTASWRFNAGNHEIRFGLEIPKGMEPMASTQPNKVGAACRSLFRHECWHGHKTERDLKMVASKLRDLNVPFSLFNLFEDARIEHAARLDEEETFGWVNFYTQPTQSSKPEQVLWSLVNGESSHFKTPGARQAKWTGGDVNRADGKGKIPANRVGATILSFYQRCFTAADTMSLLPIAVDWCDIFGRGGAGNLPRGSESVGGETVGGTTSGHGAGGGASATEAKAHQETLKPSNPEVAPSKRANLEYFTTNTLCYKADDFAAQVAPVHNRLRQIVKRAEVLPETLGQSGRLRPASTESGTTDPFIRCTEADGPRKVVVVWDCSGSMDKSNQTHGRPFLLALTKLAKARLLDVTLYLTGGGHHHKVNLRDVDIDKIANVHPKHGTETFAGTLSAVPIEVLRAASAVICYTDGQIGDGAVNAGLYRNKGVNLVGTCVLASSSETYNEGIRASLLMHFGRVITRKTGGELAAAIAGYFAQLQAK